MATQTPSPVFVVVQVWVSQRGQRQRSEIDGSACSTDPSLGCLQYDNRADDLTKDGMLKGIEQSAAFLLFLSAGVLQRPYCQMEIRHALALQKPVVLLHGKR